MPKTTARRGALWVVLALFAGCEREPIEQEHTREQRQLAEEQAEERQELNEEQREDRTEATREAARDLRDEAQDLREERRDVAQEAAEVNRLLARACTGLETNLQSQCPLDKAHVQQVSDIDDGVRLRMAAAAGTEAQIERRIDCYAAHRELSGAAAAPVAVVTPAVPTTAVTPPAPGRAVAVPVPVAPAAPAGTPMCLFDLANVDFDVDDDDGRVDIDLTSDVDARVTELRQRAREFVRQAALR